MTVTRPLTIGVTALLSLGAVTSGAVAQETKSVDVSAAADAGSRQFFVEDLTGTALTALDLGTSGQGQLFQTRVKDSNYTATTAPFTASAEMTKLYKLSGTTIDYTATPVASEKLSVVFPTTPTDVSGVSLGAIPKVGVKALLPLCSELATLLPADSPLLATVGTISTTLGSLGLSAEAEPLCTALGGATSTTPVSVDAVDNVVVTVDEKLVKPATTADHPLAVAGSTEAGNFDRPSYLGDGANDPAKPTTIDSTNAARTRKLLGGTPNSALNLDALVSPLIDGQPLFAPLSGGTGLVPVSTVVAAMQSSADAAVAGAGNALAGLRTADQTGVLSGMDPLTAGGVVASLVDSVLNKISGQYRSFPRLVADLTGAAKGNYTGTMTVTFVQQ